MDSFLILIGLAALGALVLGPVAFFLNLSLPRRMAEMERRVTGLAQLASQLTANQKELAGQLLANARGEANAAPPAPVVPPVPASAAAIPPPVPVPPVPAMPLVPETLVQEGAGPSPLQPPPLPPGPVPQTGRFASAPPAPEPVRSLEERLGAGWTVWVGGVALALGALLLVRYSIEMGLIGPGVRVLMGLALAGLLVAAGEMMRRRDRDSGAPRSDIPAVLTAAGTIAAFGAIYAAHALYGFIGPGLAFVALGTTGLACMFLASLHGPWLAGLGLAGALVVPLLVDSRNPDPWAVAIYVAVVICAAYGLARLRSWLWLAMAGAAGAGVWGLALAAGAGGSSAAVFPAGMVHSCLHMALAGWAFAVPRRAGAEDGAALPGLVPSLLALPALAVLLVGAQHHFGLGWVIWAAMPVVILALLGRALPAAAGAFAAAGLLVLAILAIWPDAQGDSLNFFNDANAFPPLQEHGLFLAFAALATGLVALLAASGLFAGAPAPIPALFGAGTACILPLATLSLVWFRLDHAPSAQTFAGVAGGLAFLNVAAATALQRRPDAPAKLGTGAFAAASISALSLALVFLLDKGMLTIAFALTAAGTAFVAARLRLPVLRWCVAALGLLVAARMAWDPRIAGAALGTVPVFNWLLYGYGIPALSFAAAAVLLRPAPGQGEDLPLRLSQALAILFSALLVFFEIRHALNGGDPFARTSSLVEQGLLALSSLGFALVMVKLDMSRAGSVFRWASLAFGLASFALTLIGLAVLQNPYWTDAPVEGGRFLNAILLAYLVPGGLALLLSRLSRGVRPEWYRMGAGFVALVMLFDTASLETRRHFMEAQIGFLRGFDQGEWYAYSAVWLVMGVVVLAYGIFRQLIEARMVSAIFVFAAVFKIFLFDLSGLDGILRALSFIGLGFVLIGIGLAYQKLVFKRPHAV